MKVGNEEEKKRDNFCILTMRVQKPEKEKRILSLSLRPVSKHFHVMKNKDSQCCLYTVVQHLGTCCMNFDTRKACSTFSQGYDVDVSDGCKLNWNKF